jgi:hypothetical protein
MEWFLLALSIFNLLMVVVVSIDVAVGGRSIVLLSNVPPPEDAAALPSVSLIVAARNEERNI